MYTNKIAIIGSGVIAVPIANRARELGIETYCFSFNQHDVACNIVDHFCEVNIFDIEKITDICRKNKVNGIIPTTELTILPSARIAANLGLNGNSINAASDITNKFLTRNKVTNLKNLRQPKYWNYVEGDLPTIDCYPVIVKPIAAGGKRGICVVNDKNKLKQAVQEALPYSKVKGVLIEEYLEGGTEYSVEGLSYKGKHYIIQVTQKDTSGPPRCNELGHHQPAKLSKEMRSKVEVTISNILTATGIQNGSSHTEIKIINDEIYLIEINARPGGDHITYPLTELSTGYPIISGMIWVALNQFNDHKPSDLENNYAGIYFVTEETSYLKPIFDHCTDYPWLYQKHQISNSLSKITFNDEDGLNYFIYYDKKEKPNIKKIIKSLDRSF